MHADALASLAAFLALPAGAAEKVLVYSHDLYCPRFAFEDKQKPTRDLLVKETLETSTGPELKALKTIPPGSTVHQQLTQSTEEIRTAYPGSHNDYFWWLQRV